MTSQPAVPMLEVRNLGKSYSVRSEVQSAAVDGISFDVHAGEFFTLLGPSGCGKTTTLRCIAGLETPSHGALVIGGETVFDAARNVMLPANKRDISMVFQSYAIWPHMTVAGNVAFPLEAAKTSAADIRTRVLEALEMVGLSNFADRPAAQLSGGQQQRVAFARAVAKNAKLLLLDEPLSNLDAKLREQMRAELHALHHRLGTTTIYVTHDQEEALCLSDRIAVMDSGKIVELGAPRQLYLSPHKEYTAQFIGQGNIWDCDAPVANGSGANGSSANGPGAVTVRSALGPVTATLGALQAPRARLMVRPEHIRLDAPRPTLGPNDYAGRVVSAAFSGRSIEYVVAVGELQIRVQAASITIHEAGDQVTVHLPPERCVILDATP
jgi:iron(III) transport system ATP-binding protein